MDQWFLSVHFFYKNENFDPQLTMNQKTQIMGAFVCACTCNLSFCFAVVFVFILSCQLLTRAKAGWGMTDDGFFQRLQRCSWQAALGCLDCSEQFEIRTYTLPSLYVTSHSQLTITNLRASCLPPIDDGSFKCLQRSSWRAVPGAMTALNGSNAKPWHCLALIWHTPLCLQMPTLSSPDKWGIPQMSLKMQLTSCSRAMDEKIHVGFFSRRFSHMRGTIWEWNVKKLEGGGS